MRFWVFNCLAIPADSAFAVGAGDAVLGFAVNPATTAEMIAVADAGEVMPQKSTYFYPKVPTGLVLAPLGPAGDAAHPNPRTIPA